MLSETMPEGAEMRTSPRHRTLKGGVIVFNNSRSTMNCVMKDQSAGGARLHFPSIVGIPEAFDLVVADLARQHCRVAWKSGQAMGVAFVAA